MQFVENGPDIPDSLLEAQEDGRLVLFCGAGISVPNGLPLFRGLVERVYEGLGTKHEGLEVDELNKGNYDRVLGFLEREDRFSAALVREQVRKILVTPENPVLDIHQAILDLSRDRSGALRLVTTNFDLLFEAAEPDVRKTAAPLIPVPKPGKWNSLVYLHGRLGEDDPDGTHLILTSADFGVAYLVERWASRFVTDLFNNFDVLFIGYSANDPVMRYLVDALAAERRRGQLVRKAFALASSAEGQQEAVDREWRAKNITPILYDEADGHSVVHRTLRAWARIWKGGLESKQNLVEELGTKIPGTLTNAAISRFCWAVADPSGAMANHFAELENRDSLGWLDVLDAKGLLCGFSSGGGPNPIPLANHDQATRNLASLDPVRRGLARWLATHAANPDLARWVVRKGGHLHPEFAWLLRRRLEEQPVLPVALKKVWTALTGSVALQRGEDAYDRFGFYGRLRQEEWSPALRLEVLQALSPCLSVRPAWLSSLEGSNVEDDEHRMESLRVSDVLSLECGVEAGNARELMLEDFRARPDFTDTLSELAFDLTVLLRRALDMMATLDVAGRDYDLGHIHHPSIPPHAQNHDFHGWTLLIDLVRDAFQAVADKRPESARSLVRIWSETQYPTFRRLVLFAARSTDLVAPAQVLSLILADPRNWLWSVTVQVELFGLLPMLWQGLDGEARSALMEAILEGPPRDMFVDRLGSEEWGRLRNRSTWERVARIDRVDPHLGVVAGEWLQGIEARHPEWRLTGQEGEDFPIWTESGWGLPTDYSAAQLLELEDEELIRVLMEHQRNREGLLDSWRNAASQEKTRALRILGFLIHREYLDVGVWSRGISALRELGEREDLMAGLLQLIERMPEELNSAVVRELADAMRAISQHIAEELRVRLLSAWDRLVTPSLTVAAMETCERVTAAINHPTGVLGEVLFDVLRSRPLERDQGIDDDVRERLEHLLSIESEPGRLARVIIGSRLALLHDLDNSWTWEHVIPRFDWNQPEEAIGAWKGYLWSPLLRPSLWSVLKPHFLEAFNHLDSIGEHVRNLASLLVSVAIEGDDAITHDEARECLRHLDDSGRVAVAMWIDRKLEGAGDRAPNLWRDRIGPWLDRAWPKEPRLRGSTTSERLASAAVRSGDAFDCAVGTVLPLIGPIKMGRLIIERLGKAGHVRSHPSSALALVNSLTGDEPDPWFGNLSNFLDQIGDVDPTVREHGHFIRLREIAIRRGL